MVEGYGRKPVGIRGPSRERLDVSAFEVDYPYQKRRECELERTPALNKAKFEMGEQESFRNLVLCIEILKLAVRSCLTVQRSDNVGGS